MRIGVPKEIKTNENRVALVPAGAEALTASGHQVFIETGAGIGSGFRDDVGAVGEFLEYGLAAVEAVAALTATGAASCEGTTLFVVQAAELTGAGLADEVAAAIAFSTR